MIALPECCAWCVFDELNARLWDGALPLYGIVIEECEGYAGRTNHETLTIRVSPRAVPLWPVLVHEMIHVCVRQSQNDAEHEMDRVWGWHGEAFECEAERVALLLDIPLTLELAPIGVRCVHGHRAGRPSQR
jgi:hypothetical protein